MKTNEFLKSLGLSNYEAEVYGALLKVERAKVKDLVKMVSVPRPMIYASLKKLVNKGICTENKGKVSHYSAVAPSVAFQDILQNEKETLQTKIKEINELNKVYKKQEKTEVPFEFIQVLKGKQIREFLKNAMSQAVKEILIFCKDINVQSEKDMKDANASEFKALKRGIKIRCLYETGCLNDDKYLPYIKKVLNEGEIGRVVDFLPMNMIILDERATFSLSQKGEKDITIFLVNHPALISLMKVAFEHLWAKGIDIKQFFKRYCQKLY